MFVPCNYATATILINFYGKKATCRLCFRVGKTVYASSVTLVRFKNKEYYLVLCLFLLIKKKIEDRAQDL
jgi:NMD protein affecting ribosome stability and mRNA decay